MYLKKKQYYIINYNLISKKNYFHFEGIHTITLLINNKLIGSSYNLLLILHSLKLLFKQKSILIKIKKDSLRKGLRKNDVLGIKTSLSKKKNIGIFFSKILFNYSNFIDLKRIINYKFSNSYVSINIKNINKIDNILLKEHKILKPINWNIYIQTSYKYKRYTDLLNTYLFCSHLGIPINSF